MIRGKNHPDASKFDMLRLSDEVDWLAYIDHAYPHIRWRFDETLGGPPYRPTRIARLRRVALPYFFGLLHQEVLFAILTVDRASLSPEELLATMALVTQGQRYFALHKDRQIRQILGPKAEPAAMRTLLKIDIFAALVLHASGDTQSLHRMAKRRAEALLTARNVADPSLFALPMAMDTIKVALPKIERHRNIFDRHFFEDFMRRAEEICRCIDKTVLAQWYGFGQAAQDMAWRGASKRTILGAAYLADTPHIRNTAMMISDLTGLVPHGADHFVAEYSAFCDRDVNFKAHENAMDQEFAWIVAQDPVKNGAKVFYNAADRQIDELQKGRVLGWCADTIHLSAKVFLEQGGGSRDALDAARQAFDDNKHATDWEQLSKFGEIIISQTRGGSFVSVNELREMANKQAEWNGLRNALDARLLQTPSPQSRRIELAHEFSSPSHKPAATMTPQQAPQIMTAPLMRSAPAMGSFGSNGRAQTMKPIPLAEQSAATEARENQAD